MSELIAIGTVATFNKLEGVKGMGKAAENERVEKLWKALKKYDIHTEEQLNEAMKEMKPLDIGCMVSPIKETVAVEE